MRLLIATLIVLGLSLGQAQTASSPSKSRFTYETKMYCSGEWVPFYAMSMKINIDAGQNIEALERIAGVKCKFLSNEHLYFVETFAFNYGGLYKVTFDEFYDPNKVRWYRWRYHDK